MDLAFNLLLYIDGLIADRRLGVNLLLFSTVRELWGRSERDSIVSSGGFISLLVFLKRSLALERQLPPLLRCLDSLFTLNGKFFGQCSWGGLLPTIWYALSSELFLHLIPQTGRESTQGVVSSLRSVNH